MDEQLPPPDAVSDGVGIWRAQLLREVDGWRQVVDLYAAPAAGASRPAVVLLHGGGWRTGSPDGYRDLACELARRFAVVVACPNYRLIDRARFPTQLSDAANAVRWLRAHAARWGVDAGRIGICGSSAGGYLSAMVALTHDDPRLAGGDLLNGESAAVQALGVQWGPLDFIARWYGNGGRAGAEEGLLGCNFLQDPTLYHHASALAHVTAAAPPALFIQGRLDPVVHQQQGELGHAAWRRHGCAAELLLLDRVGHVQEDAEDRRVERAALIGFLAARLGLARR